MRKILSTTILATVLSTLSVAPVFSAVGADVLPEVDKTFNSTVTVDGNFMNIRNDGAAGGVAIITHPTFNVGKDATVNYEMSGHNQTTISKVDATGGLSQIYGKITTSGCSGCGYDATGKVILMNPNGVMFGDGANVNLNSFTVTTLGGTYDLENNQLNLTAGSQQGDFGIVVAEGAKIHGSKNVAFASNNITLYKGSQISTDTVANVGDVAYGKVKLVTADGVSFQYYKNGAVNKIADYKTAADKMVLSVNGDIKSGNIDIRNYSTDAASEINLNGATLKAVKAEKGNDGNIWLTAANKVIAEGSTLNAGGNVQVLAGKKVSIGTSKIDATGKVDIISNDYDVVVDSTTINAKDVNVSAERIASVQNGSKVNAKNINLKSDKDVYVSNSSLNADEINIDAKNDVLAANMDLNNKKTKINAGHDVKVSLVNVADRQNGLVAKAGNDMEIKTNGDLSVSSLIAGNDMAIDAKAVISGYGKTSNVLRTEGDSADRAYIEVGGKFTSNPDFEVTDSAQLTADKAYNQRHHIQYGDGSEKILLVNNRPYIAPQPPIVPPTPEVNADVNQDQAAMANKLPRQPQSMNNNTNITDARTTFVDVFAAASQIEVVEDEEE